MTCKILDQLQHPLNQHSRFIATTKNVSFDVNWYQSIIGTRMYLAISTRLYILHSVCKLTQKTQILMWNMKKQSNTYYVICDHQSTSDYNIQEQPNRLMDPLIQIGLVVKTIESPTQA